MSIWNLFNLMGGLALFIFGMNLMSDGLKLAAGSYLKNILEQLTKNQFVAMCVGAGLTALIQSSNAMCVMVVGFVGAGLMKLERSVGVLMGAKIGTTITGQLIAFNISEIAPVIAFVGVVIIMIFKKPSFKNVGNIIASLGILFIGLGMMSSAMKPLANESWFQDILTGVSNPILAMCVGILFTVIIQSASASVGVLQMMALNSVIGFHQAFYIMLGMNIGASVAPALASIGGRKDAKRVALIVCLFESIGMILFMVLTNIFPDTLDWMAATSPANPSRQIANANTIFNVVTVLVLLPCSKYLVKLSRLIVRGDDAEEDGNTLLFIDTSNYQTGTVLLGQIDSEVGRMHHLASVNLEAATKIFYEKEILSEEEFRKNESNLDFLNKEITNALTRTNTMGLSASEAEHAGHLYHIVNDFERIGDHAENMLGYAMTMKGNKERFTGKAMKDLKQLSLAVYNIFDLACEYFYSPDAETYQVINDMEEDIDDMVAKMRNSNIKRINKAKCGATEGLYFTEILVDLERIGDHSMNIAKSVKKYPVVRRGEAAQGN
ncbi:MAG: Na/Pi cotransporter family protein [Eubacterium sp.]|nr:Na/Pi cotransporter family protein [Eubacterium sp.]